MLLAIGCLLSAVYAGLSGNYTIKPDGTGDFVSLYLAGEALTDSGISGDCVFEVFGDTLDATCDARYVAGSDSWTTTFVPGAGETPVLTGGGFRAIDFGHVRLRDLHFFLARVVADNSDGWRISGCRFTVSYIGLELSSCYYDTIDGNRFDLVPTGGIHGPAITTTGNDNVIFNNLVNCEAAEVDCLIDLDHTRNARVLFNTIRLSPLNVNYCKCIGMCGRDPNEVRNNVIVLARPAGTLDACVSFFFTQTLDSAVLNGNCCFVESLGSVGAWHTDDSLIWYDWDEWRGAGFEANGLNADPKLVSATDLHLRQGSPCIGAAAPIPGIDFDIDGDPRDPVHPDIGADEYTGGAVEENLKPQVSSRQLQPTLVRVLPPGAVAFDAMGRRVTSVKPGVYFVGEGSGAGGQGSGRIRKVVIQR